MLKGSGGGSFGATTARITPLALKTSGRIRLQRYWAKAIYKEDSQQLVLPVPKDVDAAGFLVDVLAQLVPAEAAA